MTQIVNISKADAQKEKLFFHMTYDRCTSCNKWVKHTQIKKHREGFNHIFNNLVEVTDKFSLDGKITKVRIKSRRRQIKSVIESLARHKYDDMYEFHNELRRVTHNMEWIPIEDTYGWDLKRGTFEFEWIAFTEDKIPKPTNAVIQIFYRLAMMTRARRYKQCKADLDKAQYNFDHEIGSARVTNKELYIARYFLAIFE